MRSSRTNRERRFRGVGENLLDHYRKYRYSLFVLLDRADVPAQTVIHRKVMDSFRSHWDAQACLAFPLSTAFA